MSSLSCFHCKHTIDYVPEYAGIEVACPRCGAAFVMPTMGAAPPKQQAATSVVSPRHDAARQPQRFTEARSLLDAFLDFRFEKYVTPRIVRATWVMAMLLTALWFAYFAVSTVDSFLPEKEARSVQRPAERVGVEFRAPSPLQEKTWVIVRAVTAVVTALAFLLWLRVLLEGAIVIFNIAASLASIDRKTKG